MNESGYSEGGYLKKLVFAVVPLMLFAIVTVILLWNQSGHDAGPKRVLEDKDYYIGIELIELNPLMSDGSAWDALDASAPDVYFSVFWQDQQIYKSSVKSDSLISHWSEAQFDVRKAALEGTVASLDDLMAGGRIRVVRGSHLSFHIYEKDLITESEIGVFKLDPVNLFEGHHTYHEPLPDVKRIVVRVVPMDSLPSLFEEDVH